VNPVVFQGSQCVLGFDLEGSQPVFDEASRNGFWFSQEVFFLLDQELHEVRFVQVVVRAQEVPGVPNVFLTLLKGDLFSDGIGLISHRVLWILMGIYGCILFLIGLERL